MLRQRNPTFNNRVFIIGYSDVIAIGAHTSGHIALPITFQPGTVIERVAAKQTVQWAGTSITELTLAIASATGTYLTAASIIGAPDAETYIHEETPFREAIGSGNIVPYAAFVATGADLDVLTAGEVQIIVRYSGDNFVAAGGIFG